MLLRSNRADGVEVLAVEGSFLDADAQPLRNAVEQALAEPARGVVLDLGAVTEVSDGARTALAALSRLPSGWPRATLVVAGPPAGVDLDGLVVATDRHAGARPRGRPPGAAARAARSRPRTDVGRAGARGGRGLRGPARPRRAQRRPGARRQRAGDQRRAARRAAGASSRSRRRRRRRASRVRDGGPRPPIAREADDDAEGGRGMLLVDLLSREHGVRAQPPGKAVWARLRPGRRSLG